MASIQQSINQMLSSSQLAAGLYAHTPMGKQKAEINEIKRKLPKAEQAREQQVEANLSSSAAEEAYKENLSLEEKLQKRLYELQPTEENYLGMIAEIEGREEYENAVLQSMTKRQETLTNQQEALKIRRQLLEGSPEIQVKRTKVDVDNNGKEK